MASMDLGWQAASEARRIASHIHPVRDGDGGRRWSAGNRPAPAVPPDQDRPFSLGRSPGKAKLEQAEPE
jgi:hypothetical protein